MFFCVYNLTHGITKRGVIFNQKGNDMKVNVNDYVVISHADDATIWEVVEVDKWSVKLVDVEAVENSIKNNRRPPAAQWYSGGNLMALNKSETKRLNDLMRPRFSGGCPFSK